MSSDQTIQFKQILADNNQSITSARLQTFELLVNAEPQSMNELIQKAKGKVDRVSIYRHIDLFEHLGIVKKVHIGWKYKIELSDIFTDHHHHLLCLSCGKAIDIEDERHIEAFIKTVAAERGFTVKSHQFEIEGYCQECVNQKK
jgi:Fur family ferric uptake transcriptional regulator